LFIAYFTGKKGGKYEYEESQCKTELVSTSMIDSLKIFSKKWVPPPPEKLNLYRFNLVDG